MAVTNYQVTISMAQPTVQALQGSGYSLYGFMAVQDTDAQGRPLVWYANQQIFPTLTLSWAPLYQAYISTAPIVTYNTINANASVPVAPGQTWNVQAGGGTNVTGGAGSGPAISILNTTGTQFTCGISQQQPPNGSYVPLCAFPLYGGFQQIITPVEQVLLLFSTQQLTTGTVIDSTINLTSARPSGRPFSARWTDPCLNPLAVFSPGVIIDMSASGQQSVSVSFDINAGWSWGGGSWAQSVASNADLVTLLIQPSPPATR